MTEKKYGGEGFGSTLAELQKMAPLAVTMSGVTFSGDTRKISAIVVLAGVGGELIAEIERLQTEAERLRMQLVACGVVAMSNTPESAARNRDMHPDYASASCQDVMRAVDSEMANRADAERWRFGLTVNTDEEFAKAMEPFMDWADDAEPTNAEDNNAFADKCIQIARDNGLWPWAGKKVAQ